MFHLMVVEERGHGRGRSESVALTSETAAEALVEAQGLALDMRVRRGKLLLVEEIQELDLAAVEAARETVKTEQRRQQFLALKAEFEPE